MNIVEAFKKTETNTIKRKNWTYILIKRNYCEPLYLKDGMAIFAYVPSIADIEADDWEIVE